VHPETGDTVWTDPIEAACEMLPPPPPPPSLTGSDSGALIMTISDSGAAVSSNEVPSAEVCVWVFEGVGV